MGKAEAPARVGQVVEGRHGSLTPNHRDTGPAVEGMARPCCFALEQEA